MSQNYVQLCIILQGMSRPLWAASLEGRVEVVQALLDRGAEVNQTNDVRAFSCPFLL